MSKKFLVPGSLVTSDGSVGEHGLGDLFEAADVGAIHIIDTTGTGGPGLDTASVDAAHDLLEASIHFLPIAADAHGILTLLEAAHGDASGIGGLSLRVEDAVLAGSIRMPLGSWACWHLRRRRWLRWRSR